MKNTILISGGAGFIGSHLAEELCTNNRIVILDDLSTGKIENIPTSRNITFFRGSVTNDEILTKLFADYSFDYIYHLAAIANVQDSINDPLHTHEVNADSTVKLLELSKKTQKSLKKFVFASSAAVYGPKSKLPNSEENITMPVSPYGIDKLASENFVLAYAKLFGVNTTAARFFNVYGPRQNPNSPYSGVISLLDKKVRNLNTDSSPFIVYGDGKQVRDFIYVEDIVRGLILLALTSETTGEVFNIGTGRHITLLETIESYNKFFDVEIPLKFMGTRDGDIRESYANIEKIKKIGYKAKYSLQDGLKEMVNE